MVIVAIIGIDGCGKTTQAKMLVQKLEETGHRCVYVMTAFVIVNLISGLKVRNFLSPRMVSTVNKGRRSKKEKIKKLTMCILGYPYALVTYVFIKFMSRSNIVVCDRWFYQFFLDLYGNMGKHIINMFPRPDVTFFLDGDLDNFYLRMDDLDKSVNMDYYINATNLYRRLSGKYGFCKIDAHVDKIIINNLIFDNLVERLS